LIYAPLTFLCETSFFLVSREPSLNEHVSVGFLSHWPQRATLCIAFSCGSSGDPGSALQLTIEMAYRKVKVTEKLSRTCLTLSQPKPPYRLTTRLRRRDSSIITASAHCRLLPRPSLVLSNPSYLLEYSKKKGIGLSSSLLLSIGCSLDGGENGNSFWNGDYCFSLLNTYHGNEGF